MAERERPSSPGIVAPKARRAPKKAVASAEAEPRSRSRGNSTIVIGTQLLSVIARLGGPATLTHIAEAAHLSPSRAYRYLRGLVDGNFVEQDPLSGRYDLGAEALHVGLAALGRVEPCRRAMATLPELTEKTNLVASLTVWGSHGPTVLLSEHGGRISSLRIREGLLLPLLSTAAGKIFLTYMPPHLTDPLLEQEVAAWQATYPQEEPITPEQIARIKEEVRRDGIAASFGRRSRTHANLSAPVFDHIGRLCLTISLIGISGTYDTSLTGMPVMELKRVTAKLSDRLGAARTETLDEEPAERRPARMIAG